MQRRVQVAAATWLTWLMTETSALHVFTCRHTFEPALLAELARAGYSDCSSPCAGAVLVQHQDQHDEAPDLTYALQALPCSHEVRGGSIKSLASAAAEILDVDILRSLPRGSLVTHTLVPDLLRGVPPKKAKLLRRCETVAEMLLDGLRKRYPAARRKTTAENGSGAGDGDGDGDGDAGNCDPPCAVLQLLLLEPELLVVSLALSEEHSSGLGHWPARMPAGLSPTDLDGDMPSSAYRKLLEAFAYSDASPGASDACVDLGACPGGWTAALRRRGCVVTAVDRSELAPYLMADPMVTFVQGDAFTFAPDAPVAWAVSDVIAFPERCLELLERWCGQEWAQRLVFTMKFKGAEPDFDSIDAAIALADRSGYRARAKHFFANKNEVTLMLRKAS